MFAMAGCGAVEIGGGPAPTPPYPPSPVIEGIEWREGSHVTAAPGSDLWPATWGPDDEVYLAWGDGGGFGGTNAEGRVSLGIARVEGGPRDFTPTNVNGGVSSEHPPAWDCSNCGKTAGILAVGDTLYAWLNLQNRAWPDVDFALGWSEDLGATWTTGEWVFPPEGLRPGAFVQFGPGYSSSRDEFVYSIATRLDEPTHAYLTRAPAEALRDRAAYEFFAGTASDGRSDWSPRPHDAVPFFSDPNGVGGVQLTHNRALDRYLLTVHRGRGGQLGVFDAPEPWGPWTTVDYADDWLRAGDAGGLVYNFVNKWTSEDGRSMWMVFSLYGTESRFHDRFNLIEARLRLRSGDGAAAGR